VYGKSTIIECEISDERKHREVVLTNGSDLVQFCRLLTDPNCSAAQEGCSAADLLHVCTVLLPLLSCPSLPSVPAPILGPVLQPVDTGTGGCHLVAGLGHAGVAIGWQHVQKS
jgi:hypothetical protein